MHERQVATVAGGEQRRGGLGQVLADDRGVAHLPVALGQLEAGETDRARVMSGLGVFQRSSVEGNCARLIAARRREAAVQPPQCRQASSGNRVSEGIGRPAQRGRGLIEIVLEQPGLCQRRADGELVFACQPGPDRRGQQLHRFRPASTFEGGGSARQKCLQGRGRHRGSIQGIQAGTGDSASPYCAVLLEKTCPWRPGGLPASPNSRSRCRPSTPHR
jgi:hypothetical protein